MNTTEAAVLALVLAALIVAATTKPVRKALSGWISKDRKTGRITMVLWPAGKKRKKRR